MKFISLLFCSLVLFSVAGSQTFPTQPKLSTVSEAETKIPEGMGQLIIYRTNPFGILKSPTISVDGNVKGGCLFRSALFVNLEPGKHRVSLDTANFDAETGAAKIEGLSYQGTF